MRNGSRKRPKDARTRAPDSATPLADLFRAQDSELHRGLDAVGGGKAPLVYSQREPAARVDVNEWLIQWNITKSSHEGQFQFRAANRHGHGLPALVAEFEKVFSIDI